MRRHNSFDIPYDEDFVTPGFDSLQLTEHLRHEGYVFHVLLDAYFIDTSLESCGPTSGLSVEPSRRACSSGTRTSGSSTRSI